MMKFKLIFHLWLGVLCLTMQNACAGKDANVALHATGKTKTSAEAETNTLSSPESICSDINVTISLNRGIVHVAEWKQEENIGYVLNITYQFRNKSSSTFCTRDMPSPIINSLQNYTLVQVKDECKIKRLKVCKTDLAPPKTCVCGIWEPAVVDLELSKKDTYYILQWKMKPDCEPNGYFIVKHDSNVVNTTNTTVVLNNLKPCRVYKFEIEGFRNYNIIVRRAFQLFTYPDTSLSKCTVNVSPVNVEVSSEPVSSKATILAASELPNEIKDSTKCGLINVNNFEEACYSQPNRNGKDSITPSPKCLGPQCTPPPSCPFRADTSLDTTVKPQTIGPVRDLRSSTNLERTVLLSWRPPIEGHACIKEYLITWGSESETIPASSTFYYVTDLEPCMRYNFTVNTIDQSNDKGTPATIEETVREESQLSEVTELELNEVEPRSLTAKWKAPVNGTYCVGSYRLAAWYDDPQTGEPVTVFSNTTDDLHVTFGEVIACMTYTVQVIPISFSNKDGRNDIGTLKTKERTILSYHVEPIRALSVKARSLQLSTQLLSENNNNCLLVSVRFSCSKAVDGEVDPESQIVREFVIGGNESFEGIVEPLEPFTLYQCTAQIQNIAGWSEPTPAYEFQTAEDVPESPSSLKLSGDRDSIVVAWKAPTVKNGVVVRYRIHVRMIEPKYPIPKICDPFEEYNETVDLRDEVEPEESRSWDGAEFEYTISRLNPFTMYTVQIAAATGAGVGSYTEPQDVVTLPSEPEAVQNFAIEEIEGPVLDQAYRSAVKLSWQLPCRLNGNLTRFVGRLYGTRGANGSHELTWNVEVEADEIKDTYLYVEDRLMPEYNYTVSMSVEVADVDEQSPETTLDFLSPAGIPAIEQTEDLLNVNVLDAPNPTNTARIVLGKINLTTDIGSIRYMALLISERGCQEDPAPQTGLLNTTQIPGTIKWPDTPYWHRATHMPCVKQYQTTPVRWNPMTTTSRADDPIEYVIGKEQCNDDKCNDEECDDENKYCNGPLKPGTEYALVVRVFSRTGYSDAPFRSFRTDSLIQVGLIISTVVASLLLAFIGGLLVLWRKQRLLLPTQLSGRTPTEEPSDIPLKNFPNQYDELFQSNREKVGKEFQAINYFCDTVLVETVTFFSARENERKNRYVNILPFDSNRVLLDPEESDELNANDYINASFVEGYKYQREYIATQGPKEGTCYDFWRMVLQYEIESIVMLTQPIDHDKNKCCQYYPRFNQTVEYGDIQVKCTQEMNLSLYYKRLFLVSKGIQSKAVFHYHFLDWPDHSCPASPADLIKFSKIIRTERKSYAIPLVVHCSAGVGRTGTFIALDILLQRMQQEKKINVYDTVKRLRRQRVKMVQTLDQYAFLYQCCLEFVSKLNRKKPKTSNVEAIEQAETEKRRPDIIMEVENVTVGNGDKPMFNIKFPKSVNPGLGAVASFAPSDIESGKW